MNVPGILLLYHHPLRRNAATIREHVHSFRQHSRHDVWEVNTELGFPQGLSKLSFAVTVLHYSLWRGDGYHLSERFLEWLHSGAAGYKVAFYQDEHHYCRQRFAFIENHAIDCVFTLLEPGPAQEVYGRLSKVPRLVSHIPGYVSEDLLSKARRFRRPVSDRPIDVGYRGRELAWHMGRGSREKIEIATRFAEATQGADLRIDVATRESDRLYGDRWYRFMASCKAFLGVESGVSVFDLDDAVRLTVARHLAANPSATFEEVFDLFLVPYEDNIYYRTISPRHFEAAAFRVAQVLFEGRYSGILEPGRHYLPLRKDFSNVGDVLAGLRDLPLIDAITRRAEEELVLSGNYSYEQFIRKFDEEVAEVLPLKRVPGMKDRVEAVLCRDAPVRWSRQLVGELRYLPFPGRRPLVRVVKSFLGLPPPGS